MARQDRTRRGTTRHQDGRGGGRDDRAAGKARKGGPGRVMATVLVVLVVAAVAAFVGWDLYEHRPVEVTLNGTVTTVTHGTTLQQLFYEGRLGASAGDLYSISGSLIGKGRGGSVKAAVDGTDIPLGGLAGVVLTGGESVVVRDGEDETETSHTETLDTQPLLYFDLADGLSPSTTTFQTGLLEYVEQWGYAGQATYLVGDVSGERIEQEVLAEKQDCIVRCQGIHPDNDQKLVALTFDDGPTAYTSQYLSILEDKGAHATFMLIGQQVGGYAETLSAVLAAGNQLGSHTWDHCNMPTKTADELRAELGDTATAIQNTTGVSTTLVRPPYGNMTNATWLATGGAMSSCVVWTHDSEDWELPGADAIVSNCTSWMQPGCVILMHDGGGNRDQDVEALPQVIDAWQEAGYTFVTVSQLLASDSSIPADIASGTATMPEGATWPTEVAENPYV